MCKRGTGFSARGLSLNVGDLPVYGSLFASAFFAATILPLSSEAVLAGMLALRPNDVAQLIAVAAAGNILGSCVNWILGRGLERFRDHRWFPVSAATYNAAEQRFQRYGLWSLLFAWVPLIGDPLTVVAGALRTPFLPFLALVGIGKTARYLALAAGVMHWAGG